MVLSLKTAFENSNSIYKWVTAKKLIEDTVAMGNILDTCAHFMKHH